MMYVLFPEYRLLSTEGAETPGLRSRVQTYSTRPTIREISISQSVTEGLQEAVRPMRSGGRPLVVDPFTLQEADDSA